MIRRLALAALVMAAVSPVSAQAPSFSSAVEVVWVDVLVTEDGRLVPGLRPEDFEVLDNGVPQVVNLASYEEVPLNVVLALDMSTSLDAEGFDHLRRASLTLLDGLRDTDQAALVTFSHVVSQAAPLTADADRVRAALDRASAAGQTSLVDASFTGLMVGESGLGRALLIVFSDGVDTSSWLTAEGVLDVARRSDVVTYGVEIGSRRSSFPRDLSAATGGRLLEIESTRDLDATFRGILDEFRQRYVISYSPRGVTAGGWHRLEVRVKNRDLVVRARPGYLSGG